MHGAAIGDFNGIKAAIVNVSHNIAAAHTIFARRHAWVIDGDYAALLTHLVYKTTNLRKTIASKLKLQWLCWSNGIHMAEKGGDLAPRNNQEGVVISLQFTQDAVVRGGIMLGYGDEIEFCGPGCFKRPKCWARDAPTRQAITRTITMACMAVEVATIPTRGRLSGLCLKG